MRILQIASLLSLSLFGLAACGGDSGDSGGDDPGRPDAPRVIDALPEPNVDAPPAPATIAITGTATQRTAGGSAVEADVTIAAFRNSDESTPIASATTDAQGNYTLTVDTGGVALQGYLKATKQGLKDTYLYPAAPIAADTVAPINMVSPGTYDVLFTLTGETRAAQPELEGLIALIVVDGPTAAATPIAGAKVSSAPEGAYHYNGNGGLPNSTATETAADGTAYIFHVPADVPVTVDAAKTGTTFKPHNIKAWGDQFTTTLVTP